MALTEHALTTVARTKAFLHIDPDDTEEDAWIELAINLVSKVFEGYCGRHFELQQRVNEPYTGTGRQWLVLLHRPIVSIQSIAIVGIVVTDYRYPTPEEAEAGLVFRQYGWFPGLLAIRSGLDIGDPHPSYIFYNMAVSYTAGYITPNQDESMETVTLPADLEGACWMEIDRMYTQRLARGLKSQVTPVGHSEVYGPMMMGDDVKLILDSYKNLNN